MLAGDHSSNKLKRQIMARYVTLINFTEQGAKALKNSTARAAAFRDAAEKAGVKVEAQYWTTGGYDGLLILSGKDESRILGCIAALAPAGNVRTQTLRAFDSAEFQGLADK